MHATYELEEALRRDPESLEERLIYADALLERRDPRGQLIALSTKMESGETSDRIAREVRALEQDVERSLSARLPKGAVLFCRFRGGLVDRVEIAYGGAKLPLDVLTSLFAAPELLFVRAIELRRCWPSTVGAGRALLAALPRLLAAGREASPAPVRWLGIGPLGLGDAELAELFASFPQLDGLGLFNNGAASLLRSNGALAQRGAEGTEGSSLADLELVLSDVDDASLDAVLALSGLRQLRRLVIYLEGRELDLDDLRPISSGEALPNLTRFGVIQSDEDANDEFLRHIETAPIFERLTELGFACGSLDDETKEWIVDRKERFARLSFFTAPIVGGDWAESRDHLASLLDELGREGDALRLREDLVIDCPRYGEYWSNLGDSLRAFDRREEAHAAYDRAIRLDKTLASAWSGRADVRFDLRRYAESLKDRDRAASLEDDAYTQNARGLALNALGRHEEALEAFAAAERLDRDFVLYTRGNVADTYVLQGRLEDAYRQYEQLSKRKAADLETVLSAINAMGVVRQVQGDVVSARRLFEAASNKTDDVRALRETLCNLVRLLAELGEHEAALAIYDRLCGDPRADDDDRLERARLLLEMGRAEEALVVFTEIDDDPAVSAFDRALALARLGRRGEALAALAPYVATAGDGCVAEWAAAHLAHVTLLGLDGVRVDARVATSLEVALTRGAEKSYVPEAIHAALKARAKLDGGAMECEPLNCRFTCALVGLMAALITGRETEARDRAAALASDLEHHGFEDADARAWVARQLAELCGLATPLLTACIRATESLASPAAIRTALGESARPSRTPKKAGRRARSSASGH